MYRLMDLSIGRRLGLGFGALLLILLAFAAVVSWGNQMSGHAERAFKTQTSPLTAAATEVHLAMLRVSVALRDLAIEPGDARAQVLGGKIRAVREALAELAAVAMAADDQARFLRLADSVEAFVEEATRWSGAAPTLADLEQRVAPRRDWALSLAEEFARLQREKQYAALEQMAAARATMTLALYGTSLGALLLAMAFAWSVTQSIRRPAGTLVRVSEMLQRGEWPAAADLARTVDRSAAPQVVVEQARSEMAQLGQALAAAADALSLRDRRLRADGRVAEATASCLEAGPIAQDVLIGVVEHLGAAVGVVYQWQETGRLVPIARYALDAALPTLQPGEGIPGQAAASRRMVVLANVPADTRYHLHVGFATVSPGTLAAIPVSFGETLHGVLLVGSLGAFGEEDLGFLQASARQLAVGLQNAASFLRITDLLDDLQERHAHIQAQNEEIQAQSEEIHAQSEELEAQNEELLNRSQDLAEADRRKNDFLGVLAHELRNPLAPITHGLAILERAPPGSEPCLKAQTMIARQVGHLVRLIDDLLDVTRISQGKIRLNRTRVDLGSLVRVGLDDHLNTLQDRGLKVESHLPDDPVWVEGDATRLAQVLGNLFSNAEKFTDAGGQVEVRLEVPPGQGLAVLSVRDTGIGMDPELLGGVFEPFLQGSSGLARTNGGLGLGLALVKALVELHQGSVSAVSPGTGQGSEFVVRLPLANAAGSAEAPAKPGPSAAPAPRRILIIEDNVDAAESLRELMQLDSHQVEVAYSGPEGLQRARLMRPQLILCDIGLPGMDGYEVAQRIRADPQLRDVRLVAVSGYASGADQNRARAAGFDRHLAKPLTAEAVATLLADLPR
jgi:signal transduction histidine kinase